MKTSETINEISKAISNAQGEMMVAIKGASNPFFKSKYADFAAVWEAIREPLKKSEIAVFQDVTTTDHGVSICTRLAHSSGQWIEFGPLEIPLPKRDAQSVGSAISYAKRYALSAAVGVASDDDDDGEKAMGRGEEKKSKEEYISDDQVNALTSILNECDPDYVQRIEAALTNLKIESYAKIRKSSYEKYKASALKNREEYQFRMRKAS